MNVTVENAGPCRKLLKVEFGADEVRKEYDESLGVYAKHARIKGFRPGRAPLEMIRRQYDKQILEGLEDHLLAMGFRQALKDHRLDVVAEMGLDKSELKPDLPFSFSVTVDVAPEFELPSYKGIEIDAKKVEVTDEAVQQAIDRYLENMGKYEDVAEDRPVAANDMVAVDYTATVDGRPMAEFSEKAKSLAVASDFWVIANDEYSFLPGFGPQLVGMKLGETKDVGVTFDEQSPIEDLRGKTATFSATAKKIRARAKAPIDESLFTALHVKDEAEMRETFRGALAHEAETQERQRRRDQLVGELLRRSDFDVPESEVQSESNRLVYDMVDDNMRRGVPEQEIRDNVAKITESAKTAARDRVKLRHLVKRIAAEEKLQATDAEVSHLLAMQSIRSGFRNAKAWLKAAKLDEAKVRSGMKRDLVATKVIDFALAEAKLTGEGAPAAEQKGAAE